MRAPLGTFLGAALYTYAEHRLLQLGGAFDALPAWIAAPLSQPLFILGVLFVLMVFFFPGGLVALPGRIGAAVRDRRAERTRADNTGKADPS